MKNLFIFSSFCLSVALAGCIVDVVEQNTERWAYGSGKGVVSEYFDASLYRQIFTVTGVSADTLIADGTFSLWAPGTSTASSIAQNVNLYWSVDTLHRGQLYAFAQGPEKELLSIDKMTVSVPARIDMKIDASSTDVSFNGIAGNTNVIGTSSNITFNVPGTIDLHTTSGSITGSTALGGSADGGTSDVNITLSSKVFQSLYATDTSGNVYVHVPSGAAVHFKLNTNGGSINLSYDGHKDASYSAIDYSANGGGRVVFVATHTGNITVSSY